VIADARIAPGAGGTGRARERCVVAGQRLEFLCHALERVEVDLADAQGRAERVDLGAPDRPVCAKQPRRAGLLEEVEARSTPLVPRQWSRHLRHDDVTIVPEDDRRPRPAAGSIPRSPN
jgi:hypothetical protein